MSIKHSRREFIKTSLVFAGILALRGGRKSRIIELASKRVLEMIKGVSEKVNIVWLQGQACSGDTISLLNAVDPSLIEVLEGEVRGLPKVDLKVHPTVMEEWGVARLGWSGSREWDANTILESVAAGEMDPFILVVEGSVEDNSRAGAGYFCSIGETEEGALLFEEWVKKLSKRAVAVVAVGTCAAFGGIPSGKPNPTGARGVADVLGWEWKSKSGIPVVNIPGCPAAGDWMIKALAHLLLTVKGDLPPPKLDEYNRPVFLYGQTVHENCLRGVYYLEGKFSEKYGEEYCMYSKGCKGPISYCPINLSGFVDGVGGCTSCGSPCIGCAMPGFPDSPYSPFLRQLVVPALPIKDAAALAAAIGLALGGLYAYSIRRRKREAEALAEEKPVVKEVKSE